jgi:hypothetical protein
LAIAVQNDLKIVGYRESTAAGVGGLVCRERQAKSVCFVCVGASKNLEKKRGRTRPFGGEGLYKRVIKFVSLALDSLLD